jgi:plasmid stabilization system protein ParE
VPNPVVLTPAAEADIADAVEWYAGRSAALGDQFIVATRAIIARLADNPLQFPNVHKEVRRALLRRFPYAVFYRIRYRDIQVVACFHTSRNPRRWRERA